jgi:hypothetical protein
MAEQGVGEIREQLNKLIGELEGAQKQLKKPSTIGFAERQSLTGKAGKSVVELKAQRDALEGKSDEDEGIAAQLTEANEVIGRASQVASSIAAAQPASLRRSTGTGDRHMPGQSRRGAGAMSQQRAPNRSGGE